MPTVLREGPHRFFFYAADGHEPAHVHVERDENVAKYWLDPVRLQSSGGFGRAELARIEKMVAIRREELRKAWHGYFGTPD
jgi:hypothetical protein